MPNRRKKVVKKVIEMPAPKTDSRTQDPNPTRSHSNDSREEHGNGKDSLNALNNSAEVDMNGNTTKVDGVGIVTINIAGGPQRDDQVSGSLGSGSDADSYLSSNEPSQPEASADISKVVGDSQKEDEQLLEQENKACEALSESKAAYDTPKLLSNSAAYAQATIDAICKKYSEDVLVFFQPDLADASPNKTESPSVEELCAKWAIHPKQSDDDNSAKSSVEWGSRKSCAPVKVPPSKSKKEWAKRRDGQQLAPRFMKSLQKSNYPVISPSDCGSDPDRRSSAGSSGYSTWNPVSPRDDDLDRNEYDNAANSQFLRGKGGGFNNTHRGGSKKNKNGWKFANARKTQAHGKTGAPVDAFVGQNLISNIPPLMGSELLQHPMNQNGPDQPQMPGQFVDEHHAMAVFPNGWDTTNWYNVGNQQVLVNRNGEVVPLTMYGLPPNGFPNTGMPFLIPSVPPPLATDGTGRATMMDQALPTGLAPQPVEYNCQLYGPGLADQNFQPGTDFPFPPPPNNVGYPPPPPTDVPYPPPIHTVSHSVASHPVPISSYTEARNHHAAQPGTTWECGSPAPIQFPGFNTPTRGVPPGINTPEHMETSAFATPNNAGFYTPVDTQVNGEALHIHSGGSSLGTDTPGEEDPADAPVSSAVADPQAPGTPRNDSGTTAGTPGPPRQTPSGRACVQMMSVTEIEEMQRMSANGKRMPIRNRDSPNHHISPGPQEAQEEVVKFVCDSWNKVNQECQKGSSAVTYYDSDPSQLEGFVPFDLEAYWGKRLVQNMSANQNMTANQNIPTQNI